MKEGRSGGLAMKNKKCCFFLAVCMMLVMLAFAGCGPQSATGSNDGDAFAVLTDDLGREIRLAEKPQRIVVLSASFLEPLHEVGGDVVGRPDSKTKMPEWAKDRQSVGAVYQIDMERVLACQPDLVIINKGMNEKFIEQLDSNGIASIVVGMKSYEDVRHGIALFSQVTGEKEKGDQLLADMEEKIQSVKKRLPQEKKRVAILHSTAQGLSVQLDGSIAGSIAKGLGWENVAAGMTPMEKNPDAAPYSLETLVEQNPEVLFITSMGKMDEIKQNMEKTIAESPAWQTIPAVRDGKIYYLPQDLFLLSPGIHYPEAYITMAKLLYPEAFR